MDSIFDLTLTILTTLIVLVFFVFIIYNKKHAKFYSAMARIPGPTPIPFFGNILTMIGPRQEMFPKMLKLLDGHIERGIARLWLGPEPHVLIFKDEYAEALLNNTKYLEKASVYDNIQPWLGLGLVTSFGEKWRRRRRLLTPAFHFRILEDFLPVFNEKSQILMKVLKNEVGKSFNILPFLSRAALDTICETAMGYSINAQIGEEQEYVDAVHTATDIVFDRIIFPWLRPDFIFYNLPIGKRFSKALKILKGFTKKIIIQRKKMCNISRELDISQSGKRQRLAFLDLLLQFSDEGRVLSDEDIQEEVDTFMFAGHDTTAAGVFWSIYFMGLDTDIQNKAYEEVKSVMGDSDREITLEQLKDLKYLEAVIKESSRLVSIIPTISRKITEDLQLGDYIIPAGATADIVPSILHRDPKNFPDPEHFDPERFLGDTKVRNPFAYIPFSAGPRNCIGQKFAMMEEKTMLSHFLLKYKVEVLVSKAPESRIVPGATLKPVPDIRMKIENRHNVNKG